MGFRILAGVLFAFAILVGFGWFFDPDAARAVGLIAAGLLACLLSSIPLGPVA